MKQNDYKFGNFVCELREAKGMTQSQLAAELGVTAAAVSKWENGEAKPRVDTMAKLAEILGVRTEELMAGERITDGGMDPEKVQEIYAAYRLLRQIEVHSTGKTKLRRAVAWFIDWFLFWILGVVLANTIIIISKALPQSAHTILMCAVAPLVLAYMCLYIMRDLIFHGRSPGKRLLGLYVIDGSTGKMAGTKQLAVRGIPHFVLYLEMICCLATGRTLGDRLGNTYVVSELYDPSVENLTDAEIAERVNSYDPPKKRSPWKIIAAAFIIFTVFVSFISFIVDGAIDEEMKTEEYKTAYAYLLDSGVVEYLGADEDDIRLNTISKHGKGEGGLTTKEYTFTVKMRSVTVVIHNKDGEWIVCEDCTSVEHVMEGGVHPVD